MDDGKVVSGDDSQDVSMLTVPNLISSTVITIQEASGPYITLSV